MATAKGQTQVFVTGMHRSGTSLVTRMLNLCGLYLGPDECMMPPKPDNPEGFWERIDVVRLNDQLLNMRGGAWDFPPEFEEGFWRRDGLLKASRCSAKRILDELREDTGWAIKDPRICLTAPFWADLAPGAKFVVCIRNPFEVAHSLKKRNGISERLALELWQRYYSCILDATRPEQRIVTHYGTFFDAPHKELNRINEWLGLHLDPGQNTKVCEVIKPQSRCHIVEEPGRLKNRPFEHITTIYIQLLEDSGAHCNKREGYRSVYIKGPKSLRICSEPIFVIGCPRSATSALSHSIAKHSLLWLGPESDFITYLSRYMKEIYAFGTKRKDMHWLYKQNVSESELMRYIGSGINALYADRSGGKRWVEQTPQYTLDLDHIVTMFPGVKFVEILRDGRDVVHSMINSGFPQPWATDFELACKTWVRFVLSGQEYKKKLTSNIYTIYNEHLQTDPEESFKKIMEFLELPFEFRVTTLFQSKILVNSSFKSGEKKTWRDSWSQQQKAIFQNIAGELLIKLGYEKTSSWVGDAKN